LLGFDLWQALIYVLRLDFLFGFFSEQVLSGFSFGVGLRIVFNQLGNIVQLRSNRICASELSMKVGCKREFLEDY
jgi:MFS superfamily sulfate permease-like transporter